MVLFSSLCFVLAASALPSLQPLFGRSHAVGTSTSAMSAPLPPLDLAGIKLWDWEKAWHASQWANASSTVPWRADHIVRQPDGSVAFRLDLDGAPQLQAVNGTPAQVSGRWEVDATLPILRDGLIVAPLWLYNSQTRDEIDFEFVGRRGLEVTMHAYPAGKHRKSTARLFAGKDLSGRRLRLTIALDLAGERATMFVDGQKVHVFDRPASGFFISSAVKPWIEVWPIDPGKSDLVNWAGRWQGLEKGESLTMTVHGYRYTR